MKKWLTGILCVLVLTLGLTVSANAAEIVEIVARGYCGGEGDGTNLTWTLDSEGVLRISGTGAMYNKGGYIPWKAWRSKIKTVIINDGITNVGRSVFISCTNLTSVTIPNSVTDIGSSAFDTCTSLTSVDIPDSVTSIGHSAFNYCTSLTSVVIPGSVTSIGNEAFSQCKSMASVLTQ